MTKAVEKAECVRLRVEERLSLRDISKRSGIPPGTLSYWLKPYPLSDEEKKTKRADARSRDALLGKTWSVPRKSYLLPAESSNPRTVLAAALKGKKNPTAVGFVAECAILHRLALLGMEVYVAASDGARVDFMVHTQSGRVVKVQVKSLKHTKTSMNLPLLRARAGGQLGRYLPGEFDIIIGYDMSRDVAYVLSEADVVAHMTAISVGPDSAERWDKIENFGKIAEAA